MDVIRIGWLSFSGCLLRSFVLSLTVLIAAACKSPHRESFLPGSPAIDFTFKTPEGEEKKLSNYYGKPILLHFWASWCSTCKEESPRLINASKRLGQDATILSIAVMDKEDKFKETVAAQNFPFITGIAQGQVTKLYEVTGVPESFVLDKEGRFVLMSDPRTGKADTHIVGPYQWDRDIVIQQILQAK